MYRDIETGGYRLEGREPAILHAADPDLPVKQFAYALEDLDQLLWAAGQAYRDNELLQEAQRQTPEGVWALTIEDGHLIEDMITMLAEDAQELADATLTDTLTGTQAEIYLRAISS